MEYDKNLWKPLTLTLVEYPKGDFYGKLLAIISLAPLGIGAGFISLILFRRDLHTITFFLGTLINEGLNMMLKYIIQQPRPAIRPHLYVEYGMPSSHSQFMFFFSTYTFLFVLKRLHYNSPLEKIIRILVISICGVCTALVCYGRVYLQYHTISQVIYGSFVGIFTGLLWFLVVHVLLTPFFPIIVSWKISELLLLRDTTLIPNVLWFEYTTTRNEARARSRKQLEKYNK